MPGSQLNVHLYRDSFNTPWGFRLQGGKDLHQPLTVQRVFSNSPAEGELQRGDIILAIGGEATSQLSHKGAQDAIKNAGGQINLVVNRPPPGCVNISPLSPPIVTQRPRAPSLQQPPNMPSRSPYGIYQGTTNPVTRMEPASQNGVMLNRVQSSLDNITLSPRTPDGTHRTPFYQAPGQDRQFYTPTSLLLEQQKMDEEQRRRQHQQQQQQQQQQQRQYQPQPQYQPAPAQQYHYQPPPPQQMQHPQQQQYGGGQDEVDEGEDERVVPVWERRKQFQEAPKPKPKPGVRTPKTNPIPKVSRPAPGKTSYSDFGLSYHPKNAPSTANWQPVPGPKPAHQAPPPQIVHYSSTPVAHAAPQSPVKSAPPPWQRPGTTEDETDGTPAWRNTLRTTGVKPWDVDLNYQPDQPDHAPQRESPNPQANQNQGQGQGLPGGRDWSQSQVFQFIQKDVPKKPKGKLGPATAPKPHAAVRQFDQQPHHQPQQQQRQQQHHHHQPPQQPQRQPSYPDDIGISDF